MHDILFEMRQGATHDWGHGARPHLLRSPFLRAAALLPAVAVLAACSPQPRPNVVMIVMDTVRPDYLSVYGHPRPTSPFLEAFARSATRYDRAYSVSCWTLPAHASLFSGTRIEYHRATQETPVVGGDVPLLAERLAAAGYQTVAFCAIPWVAPGTGLARGFETFVQTTTWPADGLPVEEHTLAPGIAKWLREERQPKKPLFLFVNLMEAHTPYTPGWEDAEPFFASREEFLAAGQSLFPDAWKTLVARTYGQGAPLGEEDWVDLRALYEGELRRTDEIVRRVLVEIDAASDPAQTLVFLLSDHGENLGDHGHVSHIFNLYDSNLRIALLVRGRGFAPGAKDDRLAEITDLYPTILRAAGLEAEPFGSGRDLRSPPEAGRILHAALSRPVITLKALPKSLVETGVFSRFDRSLEAVLGERFKQIRGSDGELEEYDLARDPDEREPLAAEVVPGDVRSALAEALVRAQAILERRASRAGAEGIPESIRRSELQRLGYAGDEEGE